MRLRSGHVLTTVVLRLPIRVGVDQPPPGEHLNASGQYLPAIGVVLRSRVLVPHSDLEDSRVVEM